MPQLGGYPVYPGGNSTMTPWYMNYIGRDNTGNAASYDSLFYTRYEINSMLTYRELQEALNARGRAIMEDSDKKEKEEMAKFYRVLQDTPDFVTGAILHKYSDDCYKAIDDSVYLTDAAEKAVDEGHNPIVRPEVVENSPTWFERVYKIDGNDKVTYGSKAEAQAAQTASSTSTSASA